MLPKFLKYFLILTILLCTSLAPADLTAETADLRTSRVLGGTSADLQATPTALVKNIVGFYYYSCSGVLISPRHVLTAAHCIFGSHTSSLEVTLGHKVYRAERYFIQSNYPMGTVSDYSASLDLGVIELKTPVRNVKPASLLGNMRLIPGTKLLVNGYGRHESSDTTASPLESGRIASLVIRYLYSGVIKTFYDDTSAATCAGDSGGPAFLSIEGLNVVVGITAQGSSKLSGGNCFINDEGRSVLVDLTSLASQEFLRSIPEINIVEGQNDLLLTGLKKSGQQLRQVSSARRINRARVANTKAIGTLQDLRTYAADWQVALIDEALITLTKACELEHLKDLQSAARKARRKINRFRALQAF